VRQAAKGTGSSSGYAACINQAERAKFPIPKRRGPCFRRTSCAFLAEATVSMLMGDIVEPRGEFIQADALSVPAWGRSPVDLAGARRAAAT